MDMQRHAWLDLLKKLGGYGSWCENSDMHRLMVGALRQFDLEDTLDASQGYEQIDLVMVAISRGRSLMEAVADWEKPVVGAEPATSQDSAYMRGAQWRLVMAYNAFEIVCFALMQGKYANVEQRFAKFVACCNAGDYRRNIESPKRERAVIKQWLDIPLSSQEEPTVNQTGQESYLLDFLGLYSGDRKVFERWFLKSECVDTWEGALLLAKALRNMTAHGALSATKVREFGLKNGIEELTIVLSELVSCAIGRLADFEQS